MKETEICLHCSDDYIPTRRGLQKFCSKSCKSRYWYLKQNYTKDVTQDAIENKVANPNTKVDKMSLAGVGNAAAGAAVVEVVKTVFTTQDNKRATKKDIKELKTLITGRYLPVNNAGKDSMGRSPFYDVETGNVVYI